jgi:hypothetical protein
MPVTKKKIVEQDSDDEIYVPKSKVKSKSNVKTVSKSNVKTASKPNVKTVHKSNSRQPSKKHQESDEDDEFSDDDTVTDDETSDDETFNDDTSDDDDVKKSSRNRKTISKKKTHNNKKKLSDSNDGSESDSEPNPVKKLSPEQVIEQKMIKVQEALVKNHQEARNLEKELKTLIGLVHKNNVKLSKKHPPLSGKDSGFNKKEPVPQALIELLDIKETMLSRSHVTRLLYDYFRDNNLFDKKTRKVIVPDKKIRKIFKMAPSDTITFYNMQTWLKKLYTETD